MMTKALAKRSSGAICRKPAASAKLDLALARSAHPIAMTPGEIVDVTRTCAVHDKPYIAIFQRGPDGWRLLKTTRTKSAAPGGVIPSVTLDPTGIDPASSPEICAWCSTPGGTFQGQRLSAVVCSQCGGAMCLGRMEGSFFQCRDSCGASGELDTAWICSQGTMRKEAQAHPVRAGAARPLLTEQLLLSAGAALTRKGGRS